MPSISSAVLITLFAITASFAQACPLDASPETYKEVAVACVGSNPDFSQAVVVAQAVPLPLGGECQIEPQSGESFFVVGQDLVVVDGQKQTKRVGVLMKTPSCDQKDNGGEFYSSWSPVRIN